MDINLRESDKKAKENRDSEYIWRFKLDRKPRNTTHEDPLIEFIRSQLEGLLDFIVLTKKAKPVKIDGFRLIKDPKTTHKIFLESRKNHRHYP